MGDAWGGQTACFCQNWKAQQRGITVMNCCDAKGTGEYSGSDGSGGGGRECNKGSCLMRRKKGR